MASITPAPTRVLRSRANPIDTTHTINANLSARKDQRTTKRRKRLDPWTPKRKIKSHTQTRAPPSTHFTCRICISHLPRSDFVRWIGPRLRRRYLDTLEVPADCIPHLARNPSRRSVDPVCKMCIGAFMAARLDTHGVRRVSVGCVEPGCKTAWPWETVMAYFPVEKLEEYNLAAFEHWRVDSGLFTCLAPDCEFTGLPDVQTNGYPQVSCNQCAFRSCAECRVPWHKEQTCAEAQAAAVTASISDPEMETLRLMQTRDGKRCPNCQLVIEKDGGCPSMFCPGCQKTFHWDTAASAVPGEKKALPVKHGQAYWQRDGAVLCEVDVEQMVNPDVLEQYLHDMGPWETMPTGTIELPLPDEDDPDL